MIEKKDGVPLEIAQDYANSSCYICNALCVTTARKTQLDDSGLPTLKIQSKIICRYTQNNEIDAVPPQQYIRKEVGKISSPPLTTQSHRRTKRVMDSRKRGTETDLPGKRK